MGGAGVVAGNIEDLRGEGGGLVRAGSEVDRFLPRAGPERGSLPAPAPVWVMPRGGGGGARLDVRECLIVVSRGGLQAWFLPVLVV